LNIFYKELYKHTHKNSSDHDLEAAMLKETSTYYSRKDSKLDPIEDSCPDLMLFMLKELFLNGDNYNSVSPSTILDGFCLILWLSLQSEECLK
jgi:hypothetical protein